MTDKKPDFVNNTGFKWWLDKNLSRHAKTPNVNGTTLDYQVFRVEHPNGVRNGVILDELRELIFESQYMYAIYDKINIMKLIKERCDDR